MKEDEKKRQAERCEEQGHSWENCCSVFFVVYQQCKYCGAIRGKLCD